MAIYLGIDPGVNGAVAWFEGGTKPQVQDIPTYKEPIAGKKTPTGKQRMRSMYDLVEIEAMLKLATLGYQADLVLSAVETTNPYPGQDVTSAWLQAQGLMLWPAMLVGMGLPECDKIYPQAWRKAVGLSKGDDKEASRQLALELFPNLSEELKRKKDHNRAEALLIMEAYIRERTGSPSSNHLLGG